MVLLTARLPGRVQLFSPWGLCPYHSNRTIMIEPITRKRNFPGARVPAAGDVWNVTELEEFFFSRELPAGPVRIDRNTMINDVQKFVQVELAIVRAHMGQSRYEPYMNRLWLLKNALS